MEALAGRLKQMVRTVRRSSHRVFQSERTGVHGADAMLMVLQLAMAEVNKQVSRVHIMKHQSPAILLGGGAAGGNPMFLHSGKKQEYLANPTPSN